MKGNYKSGKRTHDVLLLGATLFAVAFFFLGCNDLMNSNQSDGSAKKDSLVYYCPMHPAVISSKPGRCPKPECKGMELIPKISDATFENVLKPVNAAVLASIKTTKPIYKKMPLHIEANGYIDFDTRTMNNVSSLYSGRIEKLYIKYAYQQVHIGEKLFEVYSPELVSAQQSLVYVLNSDPDEKTLIESAKQKLIFLGFSKNSIDELMRSKKIMMTVPIYSNYEGHVHPAMNMGYSSEMNPSMESYQENKELAVKEGMYVMAGQTIFNIVNPHKLAVILQIKSEDIGKITNGLEVEMKMEDNGMLMKGNIDFIDPFFRQGMKTMTTKVYIENSEHNHKVGSLVKAKIKAEEFEALWIPVTALMDLGNEKIVWVKKGGNFSAQKVETGLFADGMVEIADGLTDASEIAIESHYLIDSEGFVKTN